MMLKKIFLILFLGFLTFQVQGQKQNIIDSLLIELEKSPKKDKFDILIEITKNYNESDSDLALDYAFNALKQARLENNNIKKGKAYSAISTTYSIIPDYDNALIYIDSAIRLSEISENEIFKEKCLNKKGIIYFKQSDYQQALHYFNSAVKSDDSMLIAQCYSNIGSIYRNLGNNNIASDYYFKALRINENNSFEEGIADVHLNIANIYLSLEEYASALDFQLKSLHYFTENNYKTETGYCLSNIGLVYLELKDIDTALYYFNRALEINTQTQDQHGIIGSLINIGHAYFRKGNIDVALINIEKARLLCIKTEDMYFLIKCLLSEVKIYKELGDIQTAVKLGKEALQISIEIDALSLTMSANLILSELYELNNNLQNSLVHYKDYNKLKDSVYTIEKTKAIQNLKIQYETENKEQQIMKLEEEKEFREKITLYLKITSAALLLTILISIYTFYLKIRNSKHKLQISKTERQKQELELAKKALENENLEKDLELRHKELATNAMNLIRNIEINSNLFQELNNLIPTAENDQKEKIRDIIRSYKIMSQDKGWREFELRFGQVHKSFYQNLSNRFPDLSPNEKKLCAFLRLNMTTKDIALLIYKSVNSINQARKRLRKKMNLSPSENLITFLSEL
jgi:tetratricopeptide (TPR) repeat protein